MAINPCTDLAIRTGLKVFDNFTSYMSKVEDHRFEINREELQNQKDFVQKQFDYEMAQINADLEKKKIEATTIQSAMDLEKEIDRQKTERFKIEKQFELISKLFDTALDAYKCKLDFYKAQLKSCDNFFIPQMQSLESDIKILNMEIAKSDERMFRLIEERDRLEHYRDEINGKYLLFQKRLTTAVRSLEIDMQTENELSRLRLGNNGCS